VIGPEHDHDVRLIVVDEVQRLVDRVGGPGVPVRAEPLLRGHRRHVVAQQAAQPPGRRDMPVQAVALVLGQHADTPDAGVDQVRQREVHQPVESGERHRWFGAVGGERRQPLSLTARQDNAKHPPLGHSPTSPG
jgi:hypothetical protein